MERDADEVGPVVGWEDGEADFRCLDMTLEEEGPVPDVEAQVIGIWEMGQSIGMMTALTLSGSNSFAHSGVSILWDTNANNFRYICCIFSS